MTAIEQELFCGGVAHWVSEIVVGDDSLMVVLHPIDRSDLRTRAFFGGVKILSVDDSYADADATLPWGIIGFDSESMGGGRWRYCLHTEAIEYCFEADWPTVDCQCI